MVTEAAHMRMAMRAAEAVRGRTAPRPWVGAVVVAPDGSVYVGATQPEGGAHAETVALAAAGPLARGATVYVTLEPCAHVGRTPACTAALVEAGVARVVVGVIDPDERVSGKGVEQLREAGLDVSVGVLATEIERQLMPYLIHRRTGRPYVVLKLAATLDGRIAAPDGTSKWITGASARRDVHQLRSRCDAIVVGAGTIRADDPSLAIRLDGQEEDYALRRVVLGEAPADARARPLLEWTGSPESLLEHLGQLGDLQVLIEGGSHVAAAFHHAGLVDRYVIYMAPAFLGGNDGVPLMAGAGAPTMSDLWRGELLEVTRLGEDVKIVVVPKREAKQESV